MENPSNPLLYKAAYDLLSTVVDLVSNMPRGFKNSVGITTSDECMAVVVLIFRASCAQEKAEYVSELTERLQVTELLLRLSRDKRLISTGQYANAIELTGDVRAQVSGWPRSAISSARR